MLTSRALAFWFTVARLWCNIEARHFTLQWILSGVGPDKFCRHFFGGCRMPGVQPQRLPRRNQTIIYRNAASHKPNSPTSVRKGRVGRRTFFYWGVMSWNKIISPPGRQKYMIWKRLETNKKKHKKAMDFSRTAGVSIPMQVAAQRNMEHTPNNSTKKACQLVAPITHPFHIISHFYSRSLPFSTLLFLYLLFVFVVRMMPWAGKCVPLWDRSTGCTS